MTVTDVYDATWSNVAHLPPGLHAGYRTGSGGVAWPLSAEAQHPGMLWYDQSPANTAADELADLLDVEDGAATFADIGPWRTAARGAYLAGVRPGQRDPGIYCSRSNVTAVCNALVAAKIAACPLVIADYDGDRAKAAAEVEAASGPYPVVGRQYADMGLYDCSVFAAHWLAAVSVAPPAHALPGSYRQVIPYQGCTTLAEVAAKRGTTVQHLVQLTAAVMTPADLALLGARVLPPGTVFYTSSP
jgi:hypothetical protein